MNIAYSYIRFSSPEQAKGRSFVRQTEKARLYSERHGLKLDNSVVFDKGVSAFRGKHRLAGALGQFIDRIDNGQIKSGSTLLIESFDRLSREDIDQAQELIKKILRAGINIVTLMDERLYTKESLKDPLALIQMIFIASRAHEESETKSRRLSDAWRRKREALVKHGQVLTRMLPAWILFDNKSRKFLLVKNRVHIIKSIFDMANKGMGKTKITRFLNSRKIKAINGNAWGTSSVQKILQNRQLVGEYQPHKMVDGKRTPDGPPISGYFPRVLSDDDFYRVQIKKGIKGPQNHDRVNNLFTGLLKCGNCNSTLLFLDKGKTWQYVVCDKAKRGAGCFYLTVRYNDLEEIFLQNCLKKVNLPDKKDTVVASEIKAVSKRINDATATIDEKRKQLQKLMLSFAGSEGELKENYNSLIKSLTSNIDKLKNALESDSFKLLELQQLANGIHDQLLTIADLSKIRNETAARIQLRNAIREIVDCIRIYPSGGDIVDGKINFEKPKPGIKNVLRVFQISYKNGSEEIFSQPVKVSYRRKK